MKSQLSITMTCLCTLALFSVISLAILAVPEVAAEPTQTNQQAPMIMERVQNGCEENGGECSVKCTNSLENSYWKCRDGQKCCVYLK
uniref:Carboxypeptidase inhibitor n=1 Tax=Rhipicephalus zambeziensis TaxID=60191 RepID=A0A224YC30_9ACAR